MREVLLVEPSSELFRFFRRIHLKWTLWRAVRRIEEAEEEKDVGTLLEYLRHRSEGVRVIASETIGRLSSAYPELLLPHVDELVLALREEGSCDVRSEISYALENLARKSPDSMIPHLEILLDLLSGEDRVRERAASILEELAKRRPDLLAPILDDLVELFRDPAKRRYVAGILTYLAFSLGRKDLVEELLSCEDGVLEVLLALGDIVERNPRAAFPYIGRLVEILKTTYSSVSVILPMMDEDPEIIKPYVEELVDFLVEGRENFVREIIVLQLLRMVPIASLAALALSLIHI